MKKVSIIVPIYNSEMYLESCIKTIVEQTYKNIEILLVNDGSNDNSKNICEYWVKKDNRIKFFNNTNNGVSYSRNYAIEKSDGDYLTFVDSDDLISNDFIEVLVKAIEENDVDCSICGIKSFYNENKIFSNQKSRKKIFCEERKEKLFNLYGGFLANKLYKKEIINKFNLKLNEKIFVLEDLLFNVEYFSKINKVVYIYKENYYYRQHRKSSYNNLCNEKWFSILDAYTNIIEMEKYSNSRLKKLIYYNFGMILAEAAYRIRFNKDIVAVKTKIYNLKKIYFRDTEYRNLNIKQRIKIFIFFTFPKIVMKRRESKMKGRIE